MWGGGEGRGGRVKERERGGERRQESQVFCSNDLIWYIYNFFPMFKTETQKKVMDASTSQHARSWRSYLRAETLIAKNGKQLGSKLIAHLQSLTKIWIKLSIFNILELRLIVNNLLFLKALKYLEINISSLACVEYIQDVMWIFLLLRGRKSLFFRDENSRILDCSYSEVTTKMTRNSRVLNFLDSLSTDGNNLEDNVVVKSWLYQHHATELKSCFTYVP